MDIILFTILGVSLAGVIVLFYRYYTAKLALEKLTDKQKFIHIKPVRRYDDRYDGNAIAGISPASDWANISSSSDGSPSGMTGGGGEFGGAGASGGWSDRGSADK